MHIDDAERLWKRLPEGHRQALDLAYHAATNHVQDIRDKGIDALTPIFVQKVDKDKLLGIGVSFDEQDRAEVLKVARQYAVRAL